MPVGVTLVRKVALKNVPLRSDHVARECVSGLQPRPSLPEINVELEQRPGGLGIDSGVGDAASKQFEASNPAALLVGVAYQAYTSFCAGVEHINPAFGEAGRFGWGAPTPSECA